MKLSHYLMLLPLVLMQGCATFHEPVPVEQQEATLAPRSSTYQDLVSLPLARGRIVASVYSFRDQTGQYQPVPASNFSTAVTQGATAMLVQALNDSGWFITLEREGLQNLLTERKIIRAAQKKPDTPVNNNHELPSLLAANILFEGGVIAYESNTHTGGMGARYLGIGPSTEYRMDQVTVNLRAVDIRTGRILSNVSTSKTILSRELHFGVFKFIEYKKLLEVEAGYTTNEPAQFCVRAAIEAAVVHSIAQGIKSGMWQPKHAGALDNPVLQRYLNETPAIHIPL